jgi:hypothetical protein
VHFDQLFRVEEDGDFNRQPWGDRSILTVRNLETRVFRLYQLYSPAARSDVFDVQLDLVGLIGLGLDEVYL